LLSYLSQYYSIIYYPTDNHPTDIEIIKENEWYQTHREDTPHCFMSAVIFPICCCITSVLSKINKIWAHRVTWARNQHPSRMHHLIPPRVSDAPGYAYGCTGRMHLSVWGSHVRGVLGARPIDLPLYFPRAVYLLRERVFR